MGKRRREAKGKLMREAEAVIDELLAWEDEVKTPDLSQIEEVVLRLRQRLSEKMAEAVIEQQDRVREVPGPKCSKCNKEMRYKGEHSKEVSSWVGDLKVRRGYYHCKECKTGFFPPGPTT